MVKVDFSGLTRQCMGIECMMLRSRSVTVLWRDMFWHKREEARPWPLVRIGQGARDERCKIKCPLQVSPSLCEASLVPWGPWVLRCPGGWSSGRK